MNKHDYLKYHLKVAAKVENKIIINEPNEELIKCFRAYHQKVKPNMDFFFKLSEFWNLHWIEGAVGREAVVAVKFANGGAAAADIIAGIETTDFITGGGRRSADK